jgi:hypothetical protein
VKGQIALLKESLHFNADRFRPQCYKNLHSLADKGLDRSALLRKREVEFVDWSRKKGDRSETHVDEAAYKRMLLTFVRSLVIATAHSVAR